MQSNTLGRTYRDTFNKRKINKKQVEELTKEGKSAIESPLRKIFSDIEDYKTDSLTVDKAEWSRNEVKLLVDILLDWMNTILEPKRIIVKDISQDLWDGQILHELIQHFCPTRIEFPEVAMSEMAQKQKIKVVLDTLEMNIVDNSDETALWSVEEIYKADAIATLRLLVKLVQTFSKEVKLPSNVSINATKVTIDNGKPCHKKESFVITGSFGGHDNAKVGTDSFDTLFAMTPEKIEDVKKSLLNFVNSHFKKLDIEVKDLETEFQDGIYLIYLMGLLGNFYVPMYTYTLPANEFSERRDNVNLVYELMDDVGISRIKSAPDEIVLGDLKATMRILYSIYSYFKDF